MLISRVLYCHRRLAVVLTPNLKCSAGKSITQNGVVVPSYNSMYGGRPGSQSFLIELIVILSLSLRSILYDVEIQVPSANNFIAIQADFESNDCKSHSEG